MLRNSVLVTGDVGYTGSLAVLGPHETGVWAVVLSNLAYGDRRAFGFSRRGNRRGGQDADSWIQGSASIRQGRASGNAVWGNVAR